VTAITMQTSILSRNTIKCCHNYGCDVVVDTSKTFILRLQK